MKNENNTDKDAFFADIERVRNELGHGIGIEEIAKKLNMDEDYATFILLFGIIG